MSNSLQIAVRKRIASRIKDRVKRTVVSEKLNNPAGLIILLATSIFFSLVIGYSGSFSALLLLTAFMGIPLVFGIFAYSELGTLVLLLIAYLLFAIGRFVTDFPLGTMVDLLEVLLIVSFLFRQKKEKNWEIFNSPVSTVVLIWVAYNLVEIANPSAESRLSWLYTIRSVALISLLYFIFVYNIRTISFVRLILKIWIALTFFGALYALKQEYIGFSPGELAYLHSDPNIQNLLFINGHWRKFSFFSDPVSFSYNMVVSSILCLSLITGIKRLWKKIVLLLLAGLFLYAMLFSGTRGAYILLPAAMVLFAILKFNKTILAMGILGALVLVFLIFIPTSNPTLYRFQSAFKPSEDASFNVRKENQKRIQPYILSHPMGGGLGATGVWGQRFAPNSYLANFPPDSGYVRVAVELGWIGLLIFCIFMFVILKTGINNYYRIKDSELKAYCLAMTLIVFAFNLGNYPQEALVQFPSNVYFYLAVALIIVTYRIDREKNNTA